MTKLILVQKNNSAGHGRRDKNFAIISDMKTIFLSILFVNFFFGVSFSSDLQDEIKKISELKGLKNAHWALSVKYVDSGVNLISLNQSKNLIPASILKIFTTAAALEYLGPEYKFKTRLYYDGKIKKGILFGNLYIVGGGDPSLGSGQVRGATSFNKVFFKWAAALRRAGIKKIRGSIYADDFLFEGIPIPSSWAWEDIGNYYAAWPAALSINDNSYKLYFKPSKKAGLPAKLIKSSPVMNKIRFANFMKTGPEGSGDLGYIFNMPKNYRAVLRGSIPKNGKNFSIKGAIPDPPVFCAEYFKKYLKDRGLRVTGRALRLSRKTSYYGKKLLSEIVSPPLRNIVHATNKKSFNLYAEMLLRFIAVKKGRRGSLDGGLYTLKEFLSSNYIDVSEMKLKDGCGLSRLNTAKAENFTNLLLEIYSKKYFDYFYNSLVAPGERGATGHIKKFALGTYLQKNIRIKSGSLNGVRSYCGYLKTRKKRLVAFTSIINNYSIKSSEINKIHKKLLLKIADEY